MCKKYTHLNACINVMLATKRYFLLCHLTRFYISQRWWIRGTNGPTTVLPHRSGAAWSLPGGRSDFGAPGTRSENFMGKGAAFLPSKIGVCIHIYIYYIMYIYIYILHYVYIYIYIMYIYICYYYIYICIYIYIILYISWYNQT